MNSPDEVISAIQLLVENHGPIPRARICYILNITPRQFRTLAGDMNRRGIPLVSTGDGFVMAKDEATIEHAANRILSQAAQMIKRAAAMKRITFAQAHEQLKLFPEANRVDMEGL